MTVRTEAVALAIMRRLNCGRALSDGARVLCDDIRAEPDRDRVCSCRADAAAIIKTISDLPAPSNRKEPKRGKARETDA